MTAEPGPTAVTTPDELPIVAMAVLLLLQVPPAMLSVNVSIALGHRGDLPLIGPMAGSGSTVTKWMALTEPQELETVYEIVATPEAMPKTLPVAATVATVGSLLLQMPVEIEPDNVMFAPTHIPEGPEMTGAAGKGLIVT